MSFNFHPTFIQPATKACTALILLYFSLISSTYAAQWSNTELQYQKGDLSNAYGSGDTNTTILTLQHVSGWEYGSNFFFVDQSSSANSTDFYAELYSTFSLGKITKKDFNFAALKDVGIVMGVNVAGDANKKKYLPGFKLSWDVSGFKVFDTTLTAYIDKSEGIPVPREDNSYMVDWVWSYPFSIKEHLFSISGHMEYIHERKNEFNTTVESWVLAQPQIRYDLGDRIFNIENQLFVGIEYQYWKNKLGDPKTDENVIQALVVWRL